jgi:hypothetical protein
VPGEAGHEAEADNGSDNASVEVPNDAPNDVPGLAGAGVLGTPDHPTGRP